MSQLAADQQSFLTSMTIRLAKFHEQRNGLHFLFTERGTMDYFYDIHHPIIERFTKSFAALFPDTESHAMIWVAFCNGFIRTWADKGEFEDVMRVWYETIWKLYPNFEVWVRD